MVAAAGDAVVAIPPGLAPFVETWTAYDARPAPAAVHHGLPSTTLTLIVAFDEPLDCGWSDGTNRARFQTLVSGLHTRPALIHTHGFQRGIQVGLTPLGARALLGVPAAALAGGLLHGDEENRLPTALAHRMQDADWPDRFRLLAEHWRATARDAHIRPELTHAWDTIRGTTGRVRIDDLAHDIGWSRRHLASRFRAEFGVTPKEATRLARFENAGQLIRGGTPLADTAHQAGYADQPHLHREWQALAGETPTAMLVDIAQYDDSAS